MSMEQLPTDVREAVVNAARKLDLDPVEVLAFYVRAGVRAVGNPAPWNVQEQEPLDATERGGR